MLQILALLPSITVFTLLLMLITYINVILPEETKLESESAESEQSEQSEQSAESEQEPIEDECPNCNNVFPEVDDNASVTIVTSTGNRCMSFIEAKNHCCNSEMPEYMLINSIHLPVECLTDGKYNVMSYLSVKDVNPDNIRKIIGKYDRYIQEWIQISDNSIGIFYRSGITYVTAITTTSDIISEIRAINATTLIAQTGFVFVLKGDTTSQVVPKLDLTCIKLGDYCPLPVPECDGLGLAGVPDKLRRLSAILRSPSSSVESVESIQDASNIETPEVCAPQPRQESDYIYDATWEVELMDERRAEEQHEYEKSQW